MPLVDPLPADHDPEIAELSGRGLLQPHAQLSTEVAEALRRHWDDGEIVEITSVIALFGFLNQLEQLDGDQPRGAREQRRSYARLAARGWKHGQAWQFTPSRTRAALAHAARSGRTRAWH